MHYITSHHPLRYHARRTLLRAIGLVPASALLLQLAPAGRILRCHPSADESETEPTPPAAGTSIPRFFFTPASPSTPPPAEARRVEEPEDEGYSETPPHPLMECIRSVFRITVAYVPKVWSESLSTWPGVASGLTGVVAGSMLKGRVRNWTVFAVGSFFVFIGKIMIDFGLATIHWDRIEALRRQTPVLNRLHELPSLLPTLPHTGVFTAGFALGFRFG